MRSFKRLAGDPDRFTVVVPTINSARWIADLHRYYSSIDVEPLYCVDSRSRDDTWAILQEVGARTISVASELRRVEALIVQLKDRVDTPWILRVDDDECPSAELIAWIRSRRIRWTHDVIAIVRRWLRFSAAGDLEFAASGSWDWRRSQNGEDRQFRLYQKDAVDYVTDIHTPGFKVKAATQAPMRALLYHFDWIVRSRRQRLEKTRAYDEQHDNSGESKAWFYLPEDIEHWDYSGFVRDGAVQTLARCMRAAGEHAGTTTSIMEEREIGG